MEKTTVAALAQVVAIIVLRARVSELQSSLLLRFWLQAPCSVLYIILAQSS